MQETQTFSLRIGRVIIFGAALTALHESEAAEKKNLCQTRVRGVFQPNAGRFAGQRQVRKTGLESA